MAEKVQIRFDPDDLTLGDMEDFEKHTGKAINDVMKPAPVFEYDEETGEQKRVYDEHGRPVSQVRMSAKDLVVLVWLILRKEREGFSLDDARNIRVTSMEVINVAEDEPAEDGKGKVESIRSRGNG